VGLLLHPGSVTRAESKTRNSSLLRTPAALVSFTFPAVWAMAPWVGTNPTAPIRAAAFTRSGWRRAITAATWAPREVPASVNGSAAYLIEKVHDHIGVSAGFRTRIPPVLEAKPWPGKSRA